MTAEAPTAEDVSARARVARMAIAVSLATAAYGISYGALAVSAGLTIWQTSLLSLLMFTGGSQFALVGVIATGGVDAAAGAIGSSVLLGTRNAFYAIQLGPVLGLTGFRRLWAGWLTIDESSAVALSQDAPTLQRRGFWLTGLGVFVGWNITTVIGALIGNSLGDTRVFGLDAVAAAAFLGLLWPRLRNRQVIAAAAAAAVIAAALTPVLSPGLPVLAAGSVALILGAVNVLDPTRHTGRGSA
ncbi:AzlC family ABC transporter permease [Klugiella xanthotipulae]|uniref:Putative branched-subunit amino acid permease n=1 Tax=Klugiella xanthotipulae TaxID=244735 RepID=A0A543HSJ1_9MICO|nr:AzlC family ABC transporter permease [Klugiella xanthotipulae]TQM61290.1 putative branched-subunit amino acid permease [Klugiella xanthotipulae]